MSIDINKTIELLRDNPEYGKILQRAVDVEEELEKEAFLFKWEDVPGEADGELKLFLYQQFYQAWIKDAVISKPADSIFVLNPTQEDSIVIEFESLDTLSAINIATAKINDGSNRAYQFEAKQHGGKIGLYRSGRVMWEWHHVRAAPAAINKLIREGIVKIAHKTNKRTEYALVDREKIQLLIDKVMLGLDEVELGIVPVIEPDMIEPDMIETPDDVFDIIVGYDDIKSIIHKGLENDKPVNILFIGTPGTAKSMFLEELNRIPGSSYHLGSSSTKAGLSDFMFNMEPRILLIDELEKMDTRDYAVLLSLMEGGKVVETKKNRRREITIKTSVFAACNSTKKIPAENLSRFHFKFIFQPYTQAEFEDVVQRVLMTREGIDMELAMYIAEKLAPITKDVREAVGISRVCENENDVDQAIKIKNKYRNVRN